MWLSNICSLDSPLVSIYSEAQNSSIPHLLANKMEHFNKALDFTKLNVNVQLTGFDPRASILSAKVMVAQIIHSFIWRP